MFSDFMFTQTKLLLLTEVGELCLKHMRYCLGYFMFGMLLLVPG